MELTSVLRRGRPRLVRQEVLVEQRRGVGVQMALRGLPVRVVLGLDSSKKRCSAVTERQI